MRRIVIGLKGLMIRVALIIQIRLAQHNIEAAERELNATKRWAQDSLLAQIAEVQYPTAFLMQGMGHSGERRGKCPRGILYLRRACSVHVIYSKIITRPSRCRDPTWQASRSRVNAKASTGERSSES